jgi:hypothetical protein
MELTFTGLQKKVLSRTDHPLQVSCSVLTFTSVARFVMPIALSASLDHRDVAP